MKMVFIQNVISDYRKLAQQEILKDPQYSDFAQYVMSLRSDKQEQRMPVLQ